MASMTTQTLVRDAESTTAAELDACLVGGADRGRVEHGWDMLLEDDAYIRLAETFRALGDPTRAKIVYSLLHQELCTCDLAAITGSSESSVSQHLRVLRQLRLVKSRRSGKLVFYSLDDAHIRILLSVCLSHVRDPEHAQAGLDQMLQLVAQPDRHSADPRSRP